MTKTVLLVSSGIFHPPLSARYWLHQALRSLPGFDFEQTGSLEILPRLEMSYFEAIVIYFHHKMISPVALNALDSFVSRGGGLLALHSATASFKREARYFEILGGQFSGHGKVKSFTVEPVPGDNEPFHGISGFSLQDEIYRHQLRPGNRIHFQAWSAGEPLPVVWTRRYGQGRVCYASPGHTSASMKHPSMQEIVRRGLAWASG